MPTWPPERPAPFPPTPERPHPPPLTVTPPPAAFTASDLESRLLDQRRVLLTGFLGDEAATRASAALMWLDATGDDPVELHVSCNDGDLQAAGALADTISLMGVTVIAHARGSIGGPALGPFCAANQRRASEQTLFRLQDPSVQFNGDARTLTSYAEHHQRALDALHVGIAHATGQRIERVAEDFGRGTVLDAPEARAYGILND
jgi:ATP-dependent Clp protease protease subunit